MQSARPYKSPSRDAQAGRTRARLVAAAWRLLRSKTGARAFSLEAVAKAAGVTRLTVYHQFGSKRALLEAVFDDRAFRGGIHGLAEAMGQSDPETSLERLVDVFCTFYGSDFETMRRLTAVAVIDPEFGQCLSERTERRRRVLGVLVERMVKSGLIAAPAAPLLIDTLFALTGFSFYAELRTGAHASKEPCAIMQRFCIRAIGDARSANGYRSA